MPSAVICPRARKMRWRRQVVTLLVWQPDLAWIRARPVRGIAARRRRTSRGRSEMRTTILAIVLLFAFEAHLSAATRTFKMVAPGCTDKELFIKIFKMIQDGDGRTAHRLLNRKIREGFAPHFGRERRSSSSSRRPGTPRSSCVDADRSRSFGSIATGSNRLPARMACFTRAAVRIRRNSCCDLAKSLFENRKIRECRDRLDPDQAHQELNRYTCRRTRIGIEKHGYPGFVSRARRQARAKGSGGELPVSRSALR